MGASFEILTEYPGPELEQAWRDCISTSKVATSYVAPEYFREPGLKGKRPFAVLAMGADRRVIAVLTGTCVGKTIECGLAVRPQFCLGLGASQAEAAGQLRTALDLLARRLLASRVVVYCWEPDFRIDGFQSRANSGAAGTILLDLSVGKDAVFKQFSDTSRNQIRKASKLGVTVTEIDIEKDFDEFHALYLDWCEFKGIKPEPYETRKASTYLRESRVVLVARHEGKIVGVSTFRFTPGGMMEYASNVSRREESKAKQNDLLIWRAIEIACDMGLKSFSMGGSHFYLKKFGGHVTTTYRLSWDRTLLKTHHGKELAINLLRRAYRTLRPVKA